MKRIIVPLLVATAAASLFADDHSMVINLNDGKTYAIHNKDIKTIKFSKNDLHDKYYVFSSDTVLLHDTLYIDKIITEYETVYVHDTIVQTKEIVLHDTITNIVTLHDTINVEVPVYIHDTIYIENPEINNIHNGHEYVDLGLPSGTLWATCNVGASNPEDYGDYFAWAATKTQTVYNWENTPYQTQKTSSDVWTTFTKYLGSTTSVYKDSSSKDSDALKTVLDPEDDAAHVNWGGRWRLPNISEMEELCDSNNCLWTWTTQNGVKGYKVTSKKNGNYLFMPAAGYFIDSSLNNTGSGGRYWSSSLDNPNYASCLSFNALFLNMDDFQRYRGQSVRPVCQ